MTLIKVDGSHVQLELTHAEFALLKEEIEHKAEINHDLCFKFPQLLGGFRDISEQIKFAFSEGLFEYQ
jgi:hypothetical protein